MTDKEILNRYCEKECKDFLQCGYSNKEHCPCHKGIKYGLAEGRKEECFEQNNDGTIRPCEVMKENAELKAQIEEQKAHCKAVDDVNEKMKCCTNCKHKFEPRKKGGYTMPCEATEYKPCDKWELAE